MRYLLLTLTLALTLGCAAIESGEGDELGVVAAEISVCPIGQWCVESPPVSGAPLLHGVFAVSANDVFAVGDHGTILRRSNDAWTAMSSGTTNDLRGVWAASSSDVWAVGVDGTIVRFNGTSWSAVNGGGTLTIDAVWGSSANDVWFAGSSRVLRWDGSSFRTYNLTGTLLTVHGTGPNDVWTTGENTFLHRFNGTSWTNVTTGTTGPLFSVHAITTTEVWITTATPTKETFRLTTLGKWAPKSTGFGFFQSLSALAGNHVWGVGQSEVGRWNGVSWTTEVPFGSDMNLWSVTTTPGHLWVVGSESLIARRSF